MPAVRGLEETFDGKIDFVLLDYDDPANDGIRRQLGITAQAQYVLVDDQGAIVARWFGIINEAALTEELEGLLQT